MRQSTNAATEADPDKGGKRADAPVGSSAHDAHQALAGPGAERRAHLPWSPFLSHFSLHVSYFGSDFRVLPSFLV